MKSFKYFAILGAFFVGAVAQADYECTAYYGVQAKIVVDEDHITPLGDTVVVLENGDGKKYLFGSMVDENGGFLKKKVVEFYGTEDTLTIVSQPKSCGRGSCDFDASPIIKADLVLNNIKTYFTCNEKIN